jgi:streptogramin lyase
MKPKPTKRATAKSLPSCQAILLCENAIRDKATDKSSVTGIFDTFHIASIPGSTPRFLIFLVLKGGAGRFAINIEVQDPKAQAVLYRSEKAGEISHSERRSGSEMRFPIPSLQFDRPGEYEMVVFADTTDIARAQFKVKK